MSLTIRSETSRMRVIRHALEITDYQAINLPTDGNLLSVAQSRTCPNTQIDLWALDHECGVPNQPAGIYIIGTGSPIPGDLAAELAPETVGGIRAVLPPVVQQFIGTVVTPSGLVWHVFEGPVRR